MIDAGIALNPAGQRLTIVDFFIPFMSIALQAKRLYIKNKASASLTNRFDVVSTELIKRELLITYKTVKVIEFTQIEPFVSSVASTCFSFASPANNLFSFSVLPALFRLLVPFTRVLCSIRFIVSVLILLCFFRILISFAGSLALFGLFVFLIGSLAFFGFLVSGGAHLALVLKTIFFIFVFTKFSECFSLATLAAPLFTAVHFGASFKQKIKPPLGQLRKRQPAQLVYQWGSINYNTYVIIKQFVPVKRTGWQGYYTINKVIHKQKELPDYKATLFVQAVAHYLKQSPRPILGLIPLILWKPEQSEIV
jgi:hypothetical protein